MTDNDNQQLGCASCRKRGMRFVTSLETVYRCPGCGGPNLAWEGPENRCAACQDCGAVLSLRDSSLPEPPALGVDWDWPDEAPTFNQASPRPPAPNAIDVLERSKDTLGDRGQEYDSPQGERSMQQIVDVYKAITGIELTEAQGWLFMVVLKIVRQQQTNGFHKDSAIDLTAYSALMAEALARAEQKRQEDLEFVPF